MAGRPAWRLEKCGQQVPRHDRMILQVRAVRHQTAGARHEVLLVDRGQAVRSRVVEHPLAIEVW